MTRFDKEYIVDVLSRLENILPDAKPLWGSFTRDTLIAHLIGAMEYSIGRKPQLPPAGHGLKPKIIGFLVMNGMVPLPKNVTFRDENGDVAPAISGDGGLPRLRELMDEFESGLSDGTLEVVPHPFFGDLGPKNMGKFHVVHIKHHLKQFGV